MNIRQLTLAGALALFATGSLWAQASEFVALRAPLSSASENPPVENESASGSVLVLIQTTRDSGEGLTGATVGFYVAITTADNPSFTAMHIHEGSAGQNGDVVIDAQFGGSVDVGSGPAHLFREVTVTSSDELATIEDLMSNPGDYYVNIHSMNNPNGVTRGQLEVVSFEDGQGGPSNSELSSQLDNVQETLSRVARRLGVVPASESGTEEDQ